MAKPDILMLTPMRPLVEEKLAPHVTLHQYWDAPDKDKLITEIGPRITGIVSFVASCPRSLIERLPKLEIIATSAVGYDGIDVKAAAERGIVVTNTPDVLTDEVADLTLGLLLATVREIPRAEKYLRGGHWSKGPYQLTSTLRGRKAGIVGLGRIGKAIAQRVESFGVSVSYYGRRKQEDVAYSYYPSVTELAAAVDVLIAVIPGGAETKHLINRQVFEALGPNGIFINVARGTVVDELAMIDALKSGTILAAGLDVFEKEPQVPAELIALPNTVLLPHVASASVYTRDEMAQLAVDNVLGGLAAPPPLTPVPETPSPR
jgi:lactate dehydrogenase-like 2-hydroxyacid dehydrogenase